MFAYCNNNPLLLTDSTGEFPWAVVGGTLGFITIMLLDNYLAKNYPATENSQGGIAYKKGKNMYGTGRVFYAEGAGTKFDKLNGITLFDFQAGMVETTYGNKYLNGSLTDLGTVRATAKVDWSGVPSFDLSALAAAYTAKGEIVVPLFIGNVTVSGAFHAGAIGAGLQFDGEEFSFGTLSPIVPGIVIEWNVNFDLYHVP